VTFYQLLTGVRPFEAGDPLEWIHCHVARTPRAPAHVVPGLPPTLSSLVMRLLAKSPEERYQSAHGLRTDLERCLQEWTATGAISSFPLGSADIAGEFRIPGKLFGRDREVAFLKKAFDAVMATRAPRVLLVSGYSGIGKSSLVRELHTPVARANGFFVSGKFDQYRRHVPYSALTQAVRELVHQALSASGERLARWIADLERALGGTGGALTEVFPEVELLIGKQPPAPKLGAAETQNRFSLAFGALVRAFAQPDHPVVLFLDDLQWADRASLNLLELLLGDGSGPVLCLLAYRDNEVDAAHPFSNTVERIRRSGARIDELAVPPLDRDCVGVLVAETLHSPVEGCSRLADLVMDKTAGNPFFVNEFLKTLYLDGLLRFDDAGPCWRWEITEIEGRAMTDNVVDLMIQRLRRLPPDAQDALRAAACIGNAFELAHLAIVTQQTLAAAAGALRQPVDEGLLRARTDAAGQVTYQFEHDRIQQAAYALIDSDRRAEAHLRIGQLLWKSLCPAELEAKLFEVVN